MIGSVFLMGRLTSSNWWSMKNITKAGSVSSGMIFFIIPRSRTLAYYEYTSLELICGQSRREGFAWMNFFMATPFSATLQFFYLSCRSSP